MIPPKHPESSISPLSNYHVCRLEDLINMEMERYNFRQQHLGQTIPDKKRFLLQLISSTEEPSKQQLPLALEIPQNRKIFMRDYSVGDPPFIIISPVHQSLIKVIFPQATFTTYDEESISGQSDRHSFAKVKIIKDDGQTIQTLMVPIFTSAVYYDRSIRDHNFIIVNNAFENLIENANKAVIINIISYQW